MELSDNEKQAVEALLSKGEKAVADWPQNRWRAVIVGSIGFSLGLYWLVLGIQGIATATNYDYYRLTNPADMPHEGGKALLWIFGTMVKMSKLTELNQQIMCWGLLEAAMGMIIMMVAASLLIVVALRWRRHERDALIYKVLRMMWDERQQGVGADETPE